MAMFYCFECDNLLDDDYHPAQEHPNDPEGLICPECLLELINDVEEKEPIEYDEWSDFDPDC